MKTPAALLALCLSAPALADYSLPAVEERHVLILPADALEVLEGPAVRVRSGTESRTFPVDLFRTQSNVDSNGCCATTERTAIRRVEEVRSLIAQPCGATFVVELTREKGKEGFEVSYLARHPHWLGAKPYTAGKDREDRIALPFADPPQDFDALDRRLREASDASLKALFPPAREGSLAEAANRFGFALFRELAKESPSACISPASVHLALCVALNGARGSTYDDMAGTLGLTRAGLDLGKANAAGAALLASLRGADPGTELEVASALWAQKGWDLRKELLDACRSFYGAEAGGLDFGDPAAAKAVNAWVSGATRGRIPEILSRASAETRLLLANAVYFKGSWKTPFDPDETRERDFSTASGAKRPCRMMKRRGRFAYARAQGAQVATLPYGSGRLEMVLCLPDAGKALDPTFEDWTAWTAALREAEGCVSLPRFRTELGASLAPALKRLGMGRAFDPRAADLSGMTGSRDLFIGEVLHRTFVETGEKGTEAAAATLIDCHKLAEAEGFEMICDRPFLYAIRDTRTGVLLFLGSVVDPG